MWVFLCPLPPSIKTTHNNPSGTSLRQPMASILYRCSIKSVSQNELTLKGHFPSKRTAMGKGIMGGRVSAVRTGEPGAMLSLEVSMTRGPEHRVNYTLHSKGCPRLPVLMIGHRENLRNEVDVWCKERLYRVPSSCSRQDTRCRRPASER